MACPRFNIDGADVQAINIGAGTGVFDSKVVNTFQFNSLVAGPGITITGPAGGEITIAGTAGAAATLQTAYDNGNTIVQAGSLPIAFTAQTNTTPGLAVTGPGSNYSITPSTQTTTGQGSVTRAISITPLTIPAAGNLSFALPALANGNFLATVRIIATSALGPETFIINMSGRVTAGVHTLTSPPQVTSSNNLAAFPSGVNVVVSGGPALTFQLVGGAGNPASPVTWSSEVLLL
jgi:hypothetical protein